MITLAALGLVLRAPPPRLLAEISEEKLELSVTPTRKLWLAEGSRWPGSQTSVEYHMRALDELVSVEPDDTLKAAAKKMNRAGVSGAPVIDASGALVGVLSRTDLLRRIARPTEASDHTERLRTIEQEEVASLMTTTPVSISPEASMSEAANLMHDLSLNRLMVVDNDQLVGILSATDVVRTALCDEISEVSYDDDEDELDSVSYTHLRAHET